MRNPSNRQSDSSREIIPDGVDFISSLPDEILHNILSNIPTKFAIRTSLLSKRWKRVWQETPSIAIDCCRHDHIKSIDETLSSYSALKITRFDVSIKCSICATLVGRWLAMSRNAENLSFKLESYCGRIPVWFYVNPSVKQLSFIRVNGDLDPKRTTVSWPSLRNLSLSLWRLSNKSFANILAGCPMLETLILNLHVGIRRLDLSRSVNLMRLDLEITGGHWIRGPDEIVAPHIHNLSLTNFRILPTLVDVSSLTEANFNLGNADYFLLDAGTIQDMVLKMLAKLQNIDKLTIGAVVLQILSLAELHGVPFPQLKIKALTVETMLVRSVLPGIIRLLQNSPGLKKITLHITQCTAIWEKNFDRYLHKQGLNKDRCWSRFFPMGEADHVALLDSIAKEDRSEHVALFMKPVLWNAKTLDTVVLWLGGCLNATEYQNFLSKVPKVSSNTNVREDGQGKATLNCFKIIP